MGELKTFFFQYVDQQNFSTQEDIEKFIADFSENGLLTRMYDECQNRFIDDLVEVLGVCRDDVIDALQLQGGVTDEKLICISDELEQAREQMRSMIQEFHRKIDVWDYPLRREFNTA